MTLVQAFLILALFGAAWLYFTRFRTMLRDRAVAVAIMLLGIVFVLFPDLTTQIATRIGVGRGTDLLLYVLSMLFVFSMVILSSRIARIESRQVELVRLLALENASSPEDRRRGLTDQP